MAGSSKTRPRRPRQQSSWQLGVIAEEKNDVDVIDELTRKVIKESAFSVSRFVGHGCGKLRRKCRSWAEILLAKGCEHLIVIHDLDRHDETSLRNELENYIKGINFRQSIVLIPIEELEAWLLADAHAIKTVFNMRRLPKTPTAPEKITDPKEYLGRLVRKDGKAQYLNTVHNRRIAREMKLGSLKRCPSFSPFLPFLMSVFPKRARM